MSDLWAVPMLVSGGLFAGGVILLALERLPAWRDAELLDFQATFARTLRRVDRIQPALAVLALISTTGYSLNAVGEARVFAGIAAFGFLAILVGSGAWLVPIQRELIVVPPNRTGDMFGLRARWIRGHLIRTLIASAVFILVAVAATS